MKTEKKEIIVKFGVKEKIRRRVGCGRDTVTAALLGLSSSELAEQIRALAIEEYGGVEGQD